MTIDLTQFAPEKGAHWTQAFAAALEALRPEGGVLRVPAGRYETGPVRLFSHTELRLEPGAVIAFVAEPEAFPLQECQDEGRITRRPQPCLSAFGAQDVAVTGQGVIDGGGAGWWAAHRAGTLQHGRPYLLHFEDCTRLRIQGVHLQNSPAWTVHPLRCADVIIRDISISNPYDSPNTDGINPESSRDVRILGCRVDVGDDCITLKSGTEDTPAPAPCENIVIADCCLVHGHGGIVIGSEMSGGVRNVTVTNCVFTGTDRGIRIKTRRRRGGRVENLRFSNLVMDGVLCPFVFNMYYCCGTREEDRWVWEKTPYPVDGGTPFFGNISISGVTATGVRAAAGFCWGLAESPVRGLSIRDCRIEMEPGAEPGVPAMMGGLETVSGAGFMLRNARELLVEGVTVIGHRGPAFDADQTVTGKLPE